MKYIGKVLEEGKWDKPHGEIYIIKERCKGCNMCIDFCPTEALEESDEINAKGYHLPRLKDDDLCVGCGYCQLVCSEFAIYVVKDEDKDEKTKKGGDK